MRMTLTIVVVFFLAQSVPFLSRAQTKPRANPRSPNSSSASIFKDVTEQVELRFKHYNGMTGQHYLPEITGSGAALIDFDNDGDLDVFVVQSSVIEPGIKAGDTQFPWRGSAPPRSRLFRNELVVAKEGVRTLQFVDVTERAASLPMATGWACGRRH